MLYYTSSEGDRKVFLYTETNKEIVMKIKLIAISAALVGALFLSACHTAAGAGQDIEQGGQAIQRAVS